MNYRMLTIRTAIILTLLLLFHQPGFSQSLSKHRVIMLTDIENEPDDTETMIRLLLYANQIDIRGLIATTSVHMKTKVYPQSIIRIIEAYRKVQPNINKHEPGYPTVESLLKMVKSGKAEYGMNGVGEGKDSEGSEWIIKTLEENDSRPLWVSVWGGANTLAQALFKLKKTKSAEVVTKLIQKFCSDILRVLLQVYYVAYR